MNIKMRLKSLEKKVLPLQSKTWALFSISYYDDLDKQKQVQQRLITTYVTEGNPSPHASIFINEIPGNGGRDLEEKCLCSYVTS